MMNIHPQIRSCYINFAEHLLNAYNPNCTASVDMYRWTNADWFRFIDMIHSFGFNTFEFWLTPKLFSPAGLNEEFGRRFTEQMNQVIRHGRARGVGVKMLVAMNTVGEQWHSHCPNIPEQWNELKMLWDEWTRRLHDLAIVGIFPGDPGGCSRNGCTHRTFIDRAIDLSALILKNQPNTRIELGTWGTPFWGWGGLKGPPGWQGEFIQSVQHTAWEFDTARAQDAKQYLLKRLPQFPKDTIVAVNLGLNSDGSGDGEQDARPWAREIAKTNPIVTWDFSLTEGENAVIPHYRFERLFAARKRERDAAPYSGGICYTMTPLLNQLSLYQSAQSFLNPDADPDALTRSFYARLFGPAAAPLAELVPLFEIIPDWGNHARIDISRQQLHRKMSSGVELLHALGERGNDIPFHPSPEAYRRELLFFFELFADLSASAADLPVLRNRYWQRVYSIYDRLSQHVDPRPSGATDRLIGFFDPNTKPSGTIPGKWTD